MRHGYFGRKLSRNQGQRRQLFMGLLRSLMSHGRIQTSLAKAKTIQPLMERLITKAKRAKSSDLNEIRKTLADKGTVDHLLAQAKTQFSKRMSGHTRIVRLGTRVGDRGEKVLLEFVDPAPQETAKVVKETKTKPAKEVSPMVQEAEVVTKKAAVKTPKKAKTVKAKK